MFSIIHKTQNSKAEWGPLITPMLRRQLSVRTHTKVNSGRMYTELFVMHFTQSGND